MDTIQWLHGWIFYNQLLGPQYHSLKTLILLTPMSTLFFFFFSSTHGNFNIYIYTISAPRGLPRRGIIFYDIGLYSVCFLALRPFSNEVKGHHAKGKSWTSVSGQWKCLNCSYFWLSVTLSITNNQYIILQNNTWQEWVVPVMIAGSLLSVLPLQFTLSESV